MFPGLDLTNDDDGVYVRPLPLLDLDDERKAAMVSNLMVVLCGESDAQPVLNTGTLYQ